MKFHLVIVKTIESVQVEVLFTLMFGKSNEIVSHLEFIL